MPSQYLGVNVLIKFEGGLNCVVNGYVLGVAPNPLFLLSSEVTISSGTLPVNPTFLNSEITITEGAI